MSSPGAELPDGFTVNLDCVGAGTVVRVSGAARLEKADLLREHLLALADAMKGRLVLDLTDLNFINSVGLGALVSAHLRCRRLGGVMKVAGPSPPIRQLLKLTRLTELFPVYDTVAEALAADEGKAE